MPRGSRAGSRRPAQPGGGEQGQPGCQRYIIISCFVIIVIIIDNITSITIITIITTISTTISTISITPILEDL